MIEHITHAEWQEHQKRLWTWLGTCRAITLAMLLATVVLAGAIVFNVPVLARCALAFLVVAHLCWLWFGRRIDREQTRVILALQADIEQLQAMTPTKELHGDETE